MKADHFLTQVMQ